MRASQVPEGSLMQLALAPQGVMNVTHPPNSMPGLNLFVNATTRHVPPLPSPH